MFNRSLALSALTIASTLGAALPAQATSIFRFSDFNPNNALIVNGDTALSNTNSGWYSDTGAHQSINGNYLAGICDHPECITENGNYNNFFVFNISSLGSTPITSLSLRVNTYETDATAAHPLNYYLFDFGGTTASLLNGDNGVTTYADLGSGAGYGQRAFTNADVDQLVTINLNPKAIADLSAAVAEHKQFFVLGGTLAPVPESDALVLFGAGLLLTVALTKRHRKA